jgi:hypothetical protein
MSRVEASTLAVFRRSLAAIALPNYGEGRSQSLASDLAQGLTQSAMNLMGEKLRRSLSHFSFAIALPNYGEGRSHSADKISDRTVWLPISRKS